MLKMLKAVVIDSCGRKTTFRTYAQDSGRPEEILAPFLASGGRIETYEWIDTLTKERMKWNEEHPDLSIPLDCILR